MRDQAPTAGIKAKAGRENFPVASHLLPRATRRHLMAIYGFARLTDDVGDEAGGDRLALLDQLERELEAAFAGTASHPIFRELSRTIVACHLQRQPFLDLIEANRQDQKVHRYQTFADLRDYCRLSAEPVGRLVLAVTDSLTPERARLSDQVCTGLQLVEHWQDVAEDAAKGRIYLPREDMDRFGVGEIELLGDVATERFVRLMAFEVERTRSLLEAGEPLAGTLAGRMRFAIAGFAGGGLAVLDAIEAANYDVLSRPVRAGKARLALRSLRVLQKARSARRSTLPVTPVRHRWGEQKRT